MKARVKWVEKVSFLGESESGHTFLLDGAPEAGGRNLGVRPMEAILIGLGGCSAFDVITILKKSRQKVTDCVVELEAQRADTVPRVFTKIHLSFIVTGRALRESSVRRAVELSAETYCSASAMLRHSVTITHDHTIQEACI